MKKLIRICCVIMLMAALVTPVYAAEKALTAAADGEKKADEASSQGEGEILTTGAEDTEEPEENPLPFELEAPKYVFADRVSGDAGAQEINIAFSKNEDMKAFFGLDKEAKDIAVRSVGIMTLNASAQIDWAIDDPEAWHADATWDTDGKNAKGEKILGDWAYVGIALDGGRQQSVRIFQDFGNPKSKDNKAWNGSGSIKGWKDILPADVLKDNGESYYIDWTEHTLYIRVRYYIFTIDNDEGVARNTYITKWSETVAVGKDAEEYAPYAMETDIPVPVISNLVVDSSDDTIGTVFTFDAVVPEDFEKNALRTEVYGGVGHLVYCVRLHQDGEWKVCYTDAVSGTVVVPMKDVLGENEVYNEGDAIELYAFLWIDQYDGINGQWIGNLGGAYSDTLTYGIKEPDITPEPTPQPTGEPTPSPTAEPTKEVKDPDGKKTDPIPTETVADDKEKDVCPVCHLDIDPQILGFCMFYWIGAAVVVLIIIVIIVKAVQRKRDEETDILFR